MPLQTDIARRSHALLTRAMEVDAPQRREFVRQECASDEELLDSLLRMLDAADQIFPLLDGPVLEPEEDEQEKIPDAVGDYLIVGVLGVGGMATVYEALQDQPKRRVALKVMHQSMTHTDAYLRFQFETETLARLHHPGIAQIYEVGAARIGGAEPSPFFAMELIPSAVPITVYADRQRLTIRERLRLFALVCDAVHHGHQHGVIHRDLKPANILVDGEGHAKVIDFGVARTTDANAVSLTAISDSRQLIGTLNYMSPEQCGMSSDIDIRTDVYSLGVILYQLACGHLPHDLDELPLPAALQTIIHDQPKRPQLLHPKRYRDLEAILLKTVEKDPQRRYDSASALASDIRHWLNHQATEARPPGVVDQLRLFARRNRALVSGVVAGLAGLLLLATISMGFVIKLTEEVERRRVAEQQFRVERDNARWQAYTAQIAGALAAVKTGEFQQMRTRLASAPTHMRGWEWGFLSALSEQSFKTVEAHNDMIMDMTVDAGWTRIATAATDGTVSVWAPQTTVSLATYESESGARATAVRILPDGRGVLSGDEDGVVRLLDATDLREIEVVAEMRSLVRSVAALPGGRIAAGTASGRAMVWSLAPRTEIPFPADQPGGVCGFEMSPDDSLMVTYNDQGHVWVRQPSDFSVVHRLQFPGRINQVRFSKDGLLLGATGASKNVLIWNLSSGELLHTIEATGGVNTVQSLAFSNDGQMLAIGLVHRGIVVCSLEDGSIIGKLGGHTDSVSGLLFSPDGSYLLSSSWDRTIRKWRTVDIPALAGGRTLARHGHHVLQVAFSPDGSMVASAARDGSLLLSDPDLGHPFAKFNTAGAGLDAVEFSPGGDLIAAGCRDHTVRLWDTTSGEELDPLQGHQSWVAAVAFDPTGKLVASGSNDQTARVWDLRTREEIIELVGHNSRVNAVQFSPDGLLLATGSRDKTVRLWNAQTGELLHDLRGHEQDVFTVLFSQDGKHLYSGSRDQTIRVWDVESGEQVTVIDGHGQYVTCLALNPDATRLAASSWFGEILMFDVKSFDLIAPFRAHESAIRGVAFSPDGRWLATASYDSTVRLFDSAKREVAEAARERAQTASDAANRAVRKRFEQMPDDGLVVSELLASLENDGEHAPWLRKSVLSVIAPPE